MGLCLSTTEHLKELDDEIAAYKKALSGMSVAHERVLQQYRELRDSKDRVIADLHAEIEMHKKDKAKLRAENDRLRQMIAYYEAERMCNGREKAV